MTTAFPQTMDFTGHNMPSRVECDVYDLVVSGTIPAEIGGTWFRMTADPQYPPMLGHDTYLSGDGMISAFRFENGHVDLKQRYVQTERLRSERAARRSLYGLYRNPFTDDASVRGKDRGTNNTTPLWHGGRLLALKEDCLPVELDPHSLETIGRWNYDGKLKSQTMTGHPRLDPESGELLFYGFEAGGLASRDVAFCVADREGTLRREVWFQAPYCSMMHDFAATKEHVIFPVFPTTADLERISAGGPHWIWESDKESFIGIMPREGAASDLRWFRGPARSAYHFMNAYTEGPHVYMDFSVRTANPFAFIREAGNVKLRPEEIRGNFVRWSFDLSKPGTGWDEYVLGPGGDMPRVAEKDRLVGYDVGYYQRFDPQCGPPLIAGPVGAGFNTITRIEVQSGKTKNYVAGPRHTVQEHVHIPSQKPDHEGYLMFVVDLHDERLSEIQLLEAASIERGPIARVEVPLRLRAQEHGTWVPQEQLS